MYQETIDHRQAVADTAARLRAASAEITAAKIAHRTAVNAWAASLTPIRVGDVVERFAEHGRPVENMTVGYGRTRRAKAVTRWRVDSIVGEEAWNAGDPPRIELLCTYIGKDGAVGKRTAEIPVGDVRPVES